MILNIGHNPLSIGYNLLTIRDIIPLALNATNLVSTQFNLNWTNVNLSTTYFIDISTDINFTTFIVNNLNVGNVNTYQITGLNPTTNYYYRVRSYVYGVVSGNSNTISVITTSYSTSLMSLVVSGGGGTKGDSDEGGLTGNAKGGGGGGGMLESNFNFNTDYEYTIIVGAGAPGGSLIGSFSTIKHNTSYVFIGNYPSGGGSGGGNGAGNANGYDGGSGGGGLGTGGSSNSPGVGGIHIGIGYGYDGAAGKGNSFNPPSASAGGGGGAGGPGQRGGIDATSGGAGGPGRVSTVDGNLYSKGGNGARTGSGNNGSPNTGNGCNARQYTLSGSPLSGGSGIVIIKYLTGSIPQMTGGSISLQGDYTLHTFTSSGIFKKQ